MSAARLEIEELLAQGLPQQAIARALGLAGPTVAYHVSKLRSGPVDPQATSVDLEKVRLTVGTRERVKQLLDAGLSRAEAARRLGLSKATVSYHARRLGLPIDERGARRYDWDAVQRYYNEGNSVRKCISVFGFSHETWQSARKRGAIVTRPQCTPAEEMFAAGRLRNRGNLKRRLLAEGLKPPRCAICGISSWRTRPLSLALHHINGDRLDNRVENLQLLCPNCHSQTDSYGGRNGRLHELNRTA